MRGQWCGDELQDRWHLLPYSSSLCRPTGILLMTGVVPFSRTLLLGCDAQALPVS